MKQQIIQCARWLNSTFATGTKFKFSALVLIGILLSINQVWGTDPVTIVSWSAAARTANDSVAPTSSQTDNSSARLVSECALSTAGTGGAAGSYYGTWTNQKSIYIAKLDLSGYSDISLTISNIRRRNATCTASCYTSTDGSTYTSIALATKTLSNSNESWTISSIGSSVKYIKIYIDGGSGNLWLGSVSISGTVTVSTYTVVNVGIS